MSVHADKFAFLRPNDTRLRVVSGDGDGPHHLANLGSHALVDHDGGTAQLRRALAHSTAALTGLGGGARHLQIDEAAAFRDHLRSLVPRPPTVLASAPLLATDTDEGVALLPPPLPPTLPAEPRSKHHISSRVAPRRHAPRVRLSPRFHHLDPLPSTCVSPRNAQPIAPSASDLVAADPRAAVATAGAGSRVLQRLDTGHRLPPPLDADDLLPAPSPRTVGSAWRAGKSPQPSPRSTGKAPSHTATPKPEGHDQRPAAGPAHTLGALEEARLHTHHMLSGIAARALGTLGYVQEMNDFLAPPQLIPARCSNSYLHPLHAMRELPPPEQGGNPTISYEAMLATHMPPPQAAVDHAAPVRRQARPPSKGASAAMALEATEEPPPPVLAPAADPPTGARGAGPVPDDESQATLLVDGVVEGPWTRKALAQLMQQQGKDAGHLEKLGITLDSAGMPVHDHGDERRVADAKSRQLREYEEVARAQRHNFDFLHDEAERQRRLDMSRMKADILLHAKDAQLFSVTGEDTCATRYPAFPLASDHELASKQLVENIFATAGVGGSQSGGGRARGAAPRLEGGANAEDLALERAVVARRLVMHRRAFDVQDDPTDDWKHWRRSAGRVALAKAASAKSAGVEDADIEERLAFLWQLREHNQGATDVSVPDVTM